MTLAINLSITGSSLVLPKNGRASLLWLVQFFTFKFKNLETFETQNN